MQPYGYGQAMQPAMPYGVDPLTGQVMSDKSKITAGLLQLLLGVFFSLGGVGRLYAGNVSLGVAQLVATVVGWVSFWCGFALILPWFISFGCWAWFVIDGIMILAGRPVDGQGRPLRS
jgi:TM2 domain-containing membrane protein YozV